jgi:hypothetical protein
MEAEPSLRRCTTCGEDKPLAKFSVKRNKGKGGRDSRCQDCERKRHEEYKDKKREADSEWRRDLDCRSRHGITFAQKKEMCKLQGGLCAICGEPLVSVDKSAVDHCHQFGYVRGIVHHSCNMLEGHLRENPKRWKAVERYVAEHDKPII